MVLNLDGPDALLDLDPEYPEWHRVAAPPGAVAGKAAERLAEDLALFQETVGTGGGSNSWALSGEKTRSGRPSWPTTPTSPPSRRRTGTWRASNRRAGPSPGQPFPVRPQ